MAKLFSPHALGAGGGGRDPAGGGDGDDRAPDACRAVDRRDVRQCHASRRSVGPRRRHVSVLPAASASPGSHTGPRQHRHHAARRRLDRRRDGARLLDRPRSVDRRGAADGERAGVSHQRGVRARVGWRALRDDHRPHVATHPRPRGLGCVQRRVVRRSPVQLRHDRRRAGRRHRGRLRRVRCAIRCLWRRRVARRALDVGRLRHVVSVRSTAAARLAGQLGRRRADDHPRRRSADVRFPTVHLHLRRSVGRHLDRRLLQRRRVPLGDVATAGAIPPAARPRIRRYRHRSGCSTRERPVFRSSPVRFIGSISLRTCRSTPRPWS